ncbi:MAG: DUF5615 family PIN-like protein [Chloroflexi bacterium]|nr:DUF5615 family PIN-like protein [Chloroflexota bacterium]
MRFLVDAQLPTALARWLTDQGHECVHVADIGMLDSSDIGIWNYATQEKAVIVTKDEDFAILRESNRTEHPQVVWIRIGNTRRHEIISAFASALPEMLSALERGEILIEVHR